MLFYDEFLKKLDEEKFQIDEIEKFSPEIKKVVVGLGVSLPLIIIAIAQLYMAKVDGNMVRVAFAIAFTWLVMFINSLRAIIQEGNEWQVKLLQK